MHYKILSLLLTPIPVLREESGVEAMVVGACVGLVTGLIIMLVRWIISKKSSVKKFLSDSKMSKEKKITVRNLKAKLKGIELQIQSCKKIEETGEMTKEEKKEWVHLAKEHKKITDEIRGLMITDHPKEDLQSTIKDTKTSEIEVWICTDCKEENPLTFETCWKCLRNKNNPLK